MVFDHLSVTLLVTGLVCFAVLLPLRYGEVEPNPWYGIRLAASFRSPEHWRRINRYGAKLLLFWTWGLVALALVLALPLPWNPDLRAVLALCYPLSVFVPLLFILRFAKRLPPVLSPEEDQAPREAATWHGEKRDKALGIGLLVVAASVMLTALPLVLGWVPPNQIYGIRLPGGFRSPADWQRINRIGGAALLLWGLSALGVGFAVLRSRRLPPRARFWLAVLYPLTVALPALALLLLFK